MVTLTKVDPEYKRLRERRESLTEEKTRLMAEAERLKDKGGRPDEGSLLEVRNRLHAIDAELAATRGSYDSAERHARASAAERIKADPSYRKQTLAAVFAWAVALEPWITLAATTTVARREGAELAPLPPAIAVQISELRAWTRLMIRAGVLDLDGLPKTLKGLLGEG